MDLDDAQTSSQVTGSVDLVLGDGVDNAGIRQAMRSSPVVLDAAAREWFAEKGYDPVYGARPLRRLLQKQVENALARGIISGQIREGSTVQFSIDGDQPVWTEVVDAE